MRLRLSPFMQAAVVAAAGLGASFAQTSSAPVLAPVPVGTPPPATVPGTTLYTKASMANTFAAANPALTFVGAASNGLIYRELSTGRLALLAGPGLTYEQDGHWYPTQLQVSDASDGSGWFLAGTSIDAKLNGGKNTDESLVLTYGSTVFKMATSKLAYSGQDTFTFEENGTTWTLRVSEYKISIQTTVSTRQGKLVAHTFAFTAPTSSALSTDNNGHFHVGEDVTITHAFVVGADRKLYDICSPWSTDTQNLLFTCDDSSLPDKAIPYVIDPSFQTGWSQTFNFSTTWSEQQSGSGQQQISYPNVSASFNISSPGGVSNYQSVSWNASGFSYSWQPTSGNPTCTYTGASTYVTYPWAYYDLNVSMTWYENGSLYTCTGSSSGEIYVTVYYSGDTVTTPNTPSGPTSGMPGLSYTYTTGGSTSSYGNPVQYQFNWGDGTSSGWLAQGVTSASHQWANPATFYVTAQAQAANSGSQSSVSNTLPVTLTGPTTTIATSPAGLTVTVDGTNYTAPHSFGWSVGSQHTIAVGSTPQSGGTGTQYTFYNWSDGGMRSHGIYGPATSSTWTATFRTQYLLTTVASPSIGGTISPAPPGGWYNAGTRATVGASTNTGYLFSGFSGGLSATSSPQTLTMNGPAAVTANFYAPTPPIAGFGYGRSMTIDHTKVPNTDQTNFPVLVSLMDPTLATVGNGGHVNSPYGYDICFYADPGGSTPLSWEMESYNGATGTVLAWVRIPAVSHTANTVFYMFYGNSAISTFQSTASAVWDSNFLGVWHLPNGTTLSANDSTANAFNGTLQGSPPAVAGQIGGAAGFNGSSQYISVSSSSTLSPANITLSAWVKPAVLPAVGQVFGMIDKRDDAAGLGGYVVELYNNGGTQQIYVFTAGNSGTSVTNSLSTISWSHLVVTQNGSTCTVYVNGVSVGSATTNPVTNFNVPLLIGSRQGGNYFNGSLDEVRLSSSARSADWIATEYHNQSSPSTFIALGSESSSGPTNVLNVTPAAPASATAVQGGAASYTISAGGFSGTVNFSVTGLPSGATADFVPATVTVSGTVTMTVYTSTGTPTGTDPLTITATSGSLNRTASTNLTVQASDPYSYYLSDPFSTTAVQLNQVTAGLG